METVCHTVVANRLFCKRYRWHRKYIVIHHAPQAEPIPPFAGKRTVSAEWSVPPPLRKRNAGQLLLAIGGVALFLQLWAFWLEACNAWSRPAAESLGWIGALGMAALQMVDFIAWNPNGILLSLTRVLLLCWPVAVMIAGVAFSRGSR